MKHLLTPVLAIAILACSSKSSDKSTTDTTASAKAISATSAGDCGNSLLFKKGVMTRTSVFDGQGKELSKQVAVNSKVYSEGGATLADWDIKSTDANGANEKAMSTTYKCDGKKFSIDLSGFMADNKQSTLETTGLDFPTQPSVGDTLPDASYKITMTMGDKTHTILSHIKERKIEAKENLATAAGTFECYRLSSVIETEINLPNLGKEEKEMMEQVRKRMGKNVMTFWYAPELTILKMELRMGGKLVSRTEVTEIKK